MDVILNARVCDVLKKFLYNSSKFVKKDALWTISNVGAGTNIQIQVLFESGLLSESLPFLNDVDYDLLKDAVYIYANSLLGGTDAQREKFCGELKGLPYIVGSIEPLRDDPITLQPVLHALEKLLDLGQRRMLESDAGVNQYAEIVEEYGGLAALESLANTGHSSVYEIVTGMIETFFERPEGDHDDIEVDAKFKKSLRKHTVIF